MENIIKVFQALFGMFTIVLVLLQVRGTSMGRGTNSSFSRRGLEKVMFKFTFISVAIFLLSSFILLII